MQPTTRQPAATPSPQVKGVNATSGGLIKATLGAAAAATAILALIWLPAEYGVDPTGVGHLLGLTEMGHIKEQLHAEADADAAAALIAQNAQNAQNAQINLTDPEIHKKLDALQTQLATIAAAIAAGSEEADQQVQPAASSQAESAPWRDEVSYTLAPGQGIEVKLVMDEGAIAEFEWSANGAVVNHDTHGDGDGQKISYEKGRSVAEQTGQLTAAFTGNHGWFWRNRTDNDVDLTLRTRGDYQDMALP